MERKLTERQREVLDFLRESVEAWGFPPTLREICARLGINGAKNAGKHLDALEKKGYIRRSSGRSRAIGIIPFGKIRSRSEDRGKDSAPTVFIPIAGRIRAGEPHPAIEYIEGHVALDADFFRCREGFLLRVEGDSMTGAGMEDGDYVLVRPQRDAENGNIVAAIINGEATVKRFIRKNDRIVLKPENPAMKPIEIKRGEGDVEIAGRVIAVIKRI
ncbi:MAG: transcriptional repressor LexA [Deltaproteobacteria bacterium]|nr:transcriptional repressor LexA [Deltaproteobacteria bacterium]